MYSKDQLNVDVKIPLTVDWKTIPGIKDAIQVFPDDEEFAYMFVINVEPSRLEEVKKTLESHPGVNSCERCAIRKLM